MLNIVGITCIGWGSEWKLSPPSPAAGLDEIGRVYNTMIQCFVR